MLDRYDQDLLLDYLEGELDADRRAQLDTMLAEDPELAALLNEMANDRAALRSLPQVEAPGDLVHDVTQTLERRMLLDDSIDDTAPIPISRAMGTPPTRSISWGRVVGLTGLAASVALAAGILVITFDDPLQRTANELADNTAIETAESAEEAAIAEDASTIADTAEGLAARTVPEGVSPPTVPGGTPESITDATTPPTDTPIDEAVALGGDGTDPRRIIPETPAGPTEPAINILGPTAAIGALQPRQQLVLFTDAPEVSREQLVAFCVANGIPVVQPDRQARSAQGQFDIGPVVLDNAVADVEADESIADYALLINESQLDTLVQNLNNDVAIEPNRAGKGSLFSNQAALLTELPEQASYAQGPAAARSVAADDGQPAGDLEAELSQDFEQAAVQQAVQLRSPDLGSDYNNTRNAYNLKAQQRGDYGQQARVVPAEQADENLAPGAALQGQPVEPQPEADLSESKKTVRENRDDQADPEAVAIQPKETVVGNDAGEVARYDVSPQQATPTIDPTRGNWLSAHLPVADTTPLLLSWREVQSAKPTKLVPVMIKRAESDKVNTLRMRQQAEFANRGNPAPVEADADAPDAVNEVEADTTPPNAPAEVEPTEPAE